MPPLWPWPQLVWARCHILVSCQLPCHIVDNPLVGGRHPRLEVDNGSGSAMEGWEMLDWDCAVANASEDQREIGVHLAQRFEAMFGIRPANADVEYAVDIEEDIP